MKSAVPSLSIDGFITNKNSQISKLFLYFLSSQYSQSNLFYGEIASLNYILAKYNNPEDLKSQIRDTLTNLYKNHFDSVEFDINVKAPDHNSSIEIYISAILIDNNQTYNFSKELVLSKSDINSYHNLLDQFYNEYLGE